MLRKTKSQKAIELRRNMILEMIMSSPNRKWTYQEIADEAQKLPWFRQHQPDYSQSTAYRDFVAVRNETKENREKLAETILVRQLDDTDEQIQNLLNDIESLGSLDEYLEMQEDWNINDIAQYAKAKNTFLNALGRMMDKQASLVPIEIPKQVQVDQTFTIDHYLQARQEIAKLDAPKLRLYSGDTVEGEYEEE